LRCEIRIGAALSSSWRRSIGTLSRAGREMGRDAPQQLVPTMISRAMLKLPAGRATRMRYDLSFDPIETEVHARHPARTAVKDDMIECVGTDHHVILRRQGRPRPLPPATSAECLPHRGTVAVMPEYIQHSRCRTVGSRCPVRHLRHGLVQAQQSSSNISNDPNKTPRGPLA